MSIDYMKLAAICAKNNKTALSSSFMQKYSQSYQEVPDALRYGFMKATTMNEMQTLIQQFGFVNSRQFYRALSAKFHPDANAAEPEIAHDLGAKLNSWWDILNGKNLRPGENIDPNAAIFQDLYQKWNVKFKDPNIPNDPRNPKGPNDPEGQQGNAATEEPTAAQQAQDAAEQAAKVSGASDEQAAAAGQQAASHAESAASATSEAQGAANATINAENMASKATADAGNAAKVSGTLDQIATKVPQLSFLSKFSKVLPLIGLILSIPSVMQWIEKINTVGIEKALEDPADMLDFVSTFSGTLGAACFVIPPLIELGPLLLGVSFASGIGGNVVDYVEHPEHGLKLFGLIPLIAPQEQTDEQKAQSAAANDPEVQQAVSDAKVLFAQGYPPSAVMRTLVTKYSWLAAKANDPAFAKRQQFVQMMPQANAQVRAMSPDQKQQLIQQNSGTTPTQPSMNQNQFSYTPKPTQTLPGFETLDAASLTLFGKPWRDVNQTAIINQIDQMFSYVPVNTGNYDHSAAQNEYLRQYLQEAKRQNASISG